MRGLGVILFLFFLIPLVSSLDAYTQGEDANIREVVRVNDGLPSALTSCNVTIWYPNGTLLKFNQPMTFNYTTFNYILNSTFTQIKGEYPYEASCVLGGLNKTKESSFFINAGGVEPNEQRALTISRSIYFIFGLGILLFIAFLFTRKLPIKITLLLMAVLFFLISLNLVFLDLQNSLTNPKFEEFFDGFTAISFILYWLIGVGIFALWMITFIVTILTKRIKAKADRNQNY